MDHAGKANQLMAEAEQKLSLTPSGGGCCGRKGRAKIEEACALYTKAANSYKMAKDWNSAGRAFAEAGALQEENQRPHECGTHYVEASKCFKKVNKAEAIKCLEKAIDVYTNMGRQKVAAKHHKTLAEMYEEPGELNNSAKSVYHYEMASSLFAGEQSTSSANRCELQVAMHNALLGDHQKAVDIYEREGRAALDSNLLRYTANDLFFRAGLCRLYLMAVRSTEQAGPQMRAIIAGYDDANPAFAECRERTLLAKLAEATSGGDVDAFNDAIRDHESIARLDPWFHEILRGIRKYVRNEPDLR